MYACPPKTLPIASMRIAITTLSQHGQNIWSAGITQNALFLAKLLRNIPFVQDVMLLDTGSETSLGPQVDLDEFGTRMVKMQDAADQVDVIIEMAGLLDKAWLGLQRARGKKAIWMCVGHPYSALLEGTIFRESGFFLGAGRHDAIWMIPGHAASAPLMETMHRCKAEVAPYLWDPCFLMARKAEIAAAGVHYGYEKAAAQNPSGSHPWKLAVFEPNLSPIKSGLIPMLIADTAYRQQPQAFSMLNMLNMAHLVQHPTLLYMANTLDMVKQHKAVFLGRNDIAGFMGESGTHAVISHQWTNDQNYLYLDALYGNYPLIHNSPWLRDAGYYYPDFEVAEGASALLHAYREHDEGLRDYSAKDSRYFDRVSIHNSDNIQRYADLLRAVCHDRPQWWGGQS